MLTGVQLFFALPVLAAAFGFVEVWLVCEVAFLGRITRTALACCTMIGHLTVRFVYTDIEPTTERDEKEIGRLRIHRLA